jgi:SAM-dependent methyltransferase
MAESNADAWGLPGVLGFFETERTTSGQVYASEWFFLKDRLWEGMSVLDVGCAQGGFAGILAEHLKDFRYTGLDISDAMIARARERFPRHRFLHLPEGDDAPLGEEAFDLVLVLGILHLHESWRETLAMAWRHTCGTMIFDLREVGGPSIEDKAVSWFRMDFGGGDASHAETRLPYNLINAGEAQRTVADICGAAKRVAHYGYLHPVSSSAVCPVEKVMANTWCVER